MNREKALSKRSRVSSLISLATAYSMILKPNGRIKCIKSALLNNADFKKIYNNNKINISRFRNVESIAAKHLTCFALFNDGTVKFEGESFDGIEEIGKYSEIISIDCGLEHFAALKSDGTVLVCGGNEFDFSSTSGWSNIKDIRCSYHCTYAIKADGSVVACGDNGNGQCNVSEWRSIENIFCAADYAIGIRKDGRLEYCGNVPDYIMNQTVGWNGIVSIAGDPYLNKIIALKSDGTAICCNEYNDESIVSSWRNLIAVYGNADIFIGLKRNGQLISVNTYKNCFSNEAKKFNKRRIF